MLGCTIVDLSAAAGDSVYNIGMPDLLVGIAGVNVFVEIKTEDGELSAEQVEFAKRWRGGPVYSVRNVDQVIDLVQRIRSKLRTQ